MSQPGWRPRGGTDSRGHPGQLPGNPERRSSEPSVPSFHSRNKYFRINPCLVFILASAESRSQAVTNDCGEHRKASVKIAPKIIRESSSQDRECDSLVIETICADLISNRHEGIDSMGKHRRTSSAITQAR